MQDVDLNTLRERLDALEDFQIRTAEDQKGRLDTQWSVLQRLSNTVESALKASSDAHAAIIKVQDLSTSKLLKQILGLEDTVTTLRDELSAARHRIVVLENAGVDYARRADWLENDVRILQTESSTHGRDIGNLQGKLV